MFTVIIVLLIIFSLLMMLLFAKMNRLNNNLSRSIDALSSGVHQLTGSCKTTCRNYKKSIAIYTSITNDVKGKAKRIGNFVTISQIHLHDLNMRMRNRNPVFHAKNLIRNLSGLFGKFQKDI